MNPALLKTKLDALYRGYDKAYLSTDPLIFLHRYREPVDREVVGIVASSLAYGQVKTIQQSVERVLNLMGAHPGKYVRDFDRRRWRSDLAGFAHRFNRGPDMILLLYYMRQMLEGSGSIGEFFRAGYRPDEQNIRNSLSNFVERTLALDCSPVYPDGILPKSAGVRFFFPSPTAGSACKRLNLYLRWMVRRDDGLDFGLWDFVSPSQLIIPLDTHIARICSLIGLAKRKTAGWSMAVEITENLKKLDASDPVKYDFAICRLGILDKCPKKPLEQMCKKCEIRKLCAVRQGEESTRKGAKGTKATRWLTASCAGAHNTSRRTHCP